jgi:hypothetical protein
MWQLWRIYDARGISHGRAQESVLLEAALDIAPLSEKENDWTMAMSWSLSDQVYRYAHNVGFARQEFPTQFPFSGDVRFLSDDALFYVLMCKLLAVLELPEGTTTYTLSHTHLFVQGAVRLYMPEDDRDTLHTLSSVFSCDELCHEAGERHRFHVLRERRIREAQQGIIYQE